MGRPVGPRQQGYLLSLLAQPSLFLPTLLPKHLHGFCLSSAPPFCFLPILLSVLELQPVSLAVISSRVLVVDAFHPSDLSMSVFALPATDTSVALTWSVREPGNKPNFGYLGFISLKQNLLKMAAVQMCTRCVNPPYTKNPLTCRAEPAAQHGCTPAVKHCKYNYLQFE